MKSKQVWKKTLLGEHGNLKNGLNFTKNDEGIGIPIVKVKDFKDRTFVPKNGLDEIDSDGIKILNEYFLKEGDIIIVRSNGNRELVGRSIFYDKKITATTFSGFCIRFRPNKQTVNPGFILYFLKSPMCREILSRMVSGTNIQNVNQNMLFNLPLLLPTIPEQNKIVKILNDLNIKIQNLQNQNKVLEQITQRIFKSWFIDFDGVTEFDDSELGKIPKTWKISPLNEIGNIQQGYAFKSKNFQENGVRIIKIKNIEKIENTVNIYSGSSVSLKLSQTIDPKFNLSSGDILIAMTGAELGKVGIIPKNEMTLLLNQRVGKIVSKYKTLFYLFLTSNRIQNKLKNFSSASSAQGNISNNDIEMIEIPLPKENKILDVFDKYTNPMFNQIALNLGLTESLKSILTQLLPKLMSGEIRV